MNRVRRSYIRGLNLCLRKINEEQLGVLQSDLGSNHPSENNKTEFALWVKAVVNIHLDHVKTSITAEVKRLKQK